MTTQGKYSIMEYLKLYSLGKVPALSYPSCRVPVVGCRGCGLNRPDDGTRCSFCGVYQHCTFNVKTDPPITPTTDGRVDLPATVAMRRVRAGFQRGKSKRTSKSKVNPRRTNSNVK